MRRIAAALIACALVAGCASTPNEEVQLGGISLVEVIDGLGNRTAQVLKNLRGGGSVERAAADLASINDGYDDLIFHAWKLSPDGQKELAKRAERHIPAVQDLIRAVDGSSLEAALLDPLEAMRTKVGILASTPYRQPE